MGKFAWFATLAAILAPMAADSMGWGAEGFATFAYEALLDTGLPPGIIALAGAICGLSLLKPAEN